MIVSFALCGSMFAQHVSHWSDQGNPSSTYETYADLVAYVSIDNVPIAHTDNFADFEVGAFVNGTFRGSIFLESYLEEFGDPYPVAELGIWYDPVASDTGKEVALKLYDHQSNHEYDIFTSATMDNNSVTIITGDEHNEQYFSPEHEAIMLSFSTPTFTKEITPIGVDSGWYFIASPIGEVAPANVNNMTSNTFDLYRFNQSVEKEWENYKDTEHGHEHFNLEPGKGYLYANSGDGNNTYTLTFRGFPYEGSGVVTLTKDDVNTDFPGWNLVGNPFSQTATVSKTSFYIINPNGRFNVIASTGSTIEAMEGIFVTADTDGETLTFSTSNPDKISRQLIVNLTASNTRGGAIDRAIVRFDECSVLPKFQLFEGNAKLYIPQDGKDYAVVGADKDGEMPLYFKAAENGTYTLSFSTEGINMGYLHLIDNLTGNDVDLLATPSYSFDARTIDYASRFKLVFSAQDNNNDHFAFISNGQIILTGVDANATIQVVDALGRVVVSRTLSGQSISTKGMTAGVYVLRLIEGNETRTQKIIVK